MNTASKLSLAVVALLAVGVSSAQAQQATIQATATVQTALTVNNVADLAYGAVYPGQGNQTIAAADGNSGQFSLTGNPGSQVQLTFTLPTQLTGTGAPMAIGTWSGLYNNIATPGGAALTVTAPALVTVDAGGSNWIFIGATLTVPAVQTAGAYSADIILDAVYTGN